MNPAQNEILKNYFGAKAVPVFTKKSFLSGSLKTETLYMNYKLNELHETTFIGKDFTYRQRIKRMAARTVAKFERMPTLQRQAVIEALYAKYPPPSGNKDRNNYTI